MKVSVAMTTYNGEKYLRRQLDSLLLQQRPIDELVVCDDCSADGTWDLLQEYRSSHPAFPMFLHRNPENLGYRKNFRQALELCSGDIFFFCDQDDIWNPEKIRDMCSVLEEKPEIQVLASSFTLIDSNDAPIAVRKIRGWSNNNLYSAEVAEGALVRIPLEKLVFHNLCQGCAQAFREPLRRQFLDHFTENMHHDWQLNVLAASQGGLWFLNRPLFRYRIHAENTLGLTGNTALTDKWDFLYRSIETREGLAVLEQIRAIAPEAAASDAGVIRRGHFLENNLKNLREKRTFPLLLQLADPLYSELRQGWRARAADLVYTMRR